MDSSAPELQRLLQEAKRHLARAELHEAITRATEAIRLDGKEPAAYLIRADALRRLKKLDRALADLAVAIRLDPQQPGPYVIRAEILKRRNILDQAIADATQAIQLAPDQAAAYSVRAECRNALGDCDGATEDIEEMLLLDPTRPVPDLSVRSHATATSEPSTDDMTRRRTGQPNPAHVDMFADGKPVDKSYRSHNGVSDEDAPETLGATSGYRPGTVVRPIPRVDGRARKSSARRRGAPVLMIGVVVSAACALWIIFRGSPESVTNPKPTDRQQAQVVLPQDDEESNFPTPPANVQRTGPVDSLVVANPAVDKGDEQEVINVLAMLNPERQSVTGRWRMDDGRLLSPRTSGATIMLPVRVPREYDLRVQVDRTAGQDTFAIGLVVDGRLCVVSLDSETKAGRGSGIERINGQPMFKNGTMRRGRLLDQRPVLIECQVRRNSIAVRADGKPVVEWHGDPSRLSLEPAWVVGDESSLFLGLWETEHSIDRIELVPLPRTTSEPETNGQQSDTKPAEFRRFNDLNGTWLAFTEETVGKRVAKAEMQKKRKTPRVEGDKFTLSTSYYKTEGTIRQIPGGDGHAIDLAGRYIEGGNGKDVLLKAIFDVRQDTLRLCYSYNVDTQDNDRPTEFETDESHPGLCVTFKKSE